MKEKEREVGNVTRHKLNTLREIFSCVTMGWPITLYLADTEKKKANLSLRPCIYSCINTVLLPRFCRNDVYEQTFAEDSFTFVKVMNCERVYDRIYDDVDL